MAHIQEKFYHRKKTEGLDHAMIGTWTQSRMGQHKPKPFFTLLRHACESSGIAPAPLDGLEALNAKAKIEALAERLAAPAAEICLLERIKRPRGREEVDCLAISCLYNESFIDLAKRSGEARYARAGKMWTLPLAPLDDVFLEDLLQHFRHLVDVNETLHFTSPSDVLRTTPARDFDLLPEPFQVDPVRMLDAFRRARPSDTLVLRHAGLFHDGAFQPLPERLFATRHPLLLLRLPVEGMLRYATWSVITGEIETLVFANEKRKVSRLIGRYSRTIEEIGAVVLLESDPVQAPARADGNSGQEILRNAKAEALAIPIACAREISAVIPDAGLLPLPRSWSADMARQGGRLRGGFRAWTGPLLRNEHFQKLGRLLLGLAGKRAILFDDVELERIATGRIGRDAVKTRLLEEFARSLSRELRVRIPGEPRMQAGVAHTMTLMLLDQLVNAGKGLATIGGDYLQRAKEAGVPNAEAHLRLKGMIDARRHWARAPGGSRPRNVDEIIGVLRHGLEAGLAEGHWASASSDRGARR
jgi:hypothetical protein